MSDRRSKIVTLYPAFDKYTAQSDPTRPAPMIVAVFCCSMRVVLRVKQK